MILHVLNIFTCARIHVVIHFDISKILDIVFHLLLARSGVHEALHSKVRVAKINLLGIVCGLQ